MSLKRVISPYTYYNEINKKISFEDSYPQTENPELFMWSLRFQQLNRFPIPRPFIERHNLHPTTNNVDYSQQEISSPKRGQIKVQNQQQIQIQFGKENNKKKRIQMNKQKFSILQRNSQSCQNFLNQPLLIKVLSQTPLEKLNKVYKKKTEFISNFTSTCSSSTIRKQFILPKQNSSLRNDVGKIVAMVDNHIKLRTKSKSKLLKKLQESGLGPEKSTLSSSQKCNTSRKEVIQQQIDVIPIEKQIILKQNGAKGFKIRETIEMDKFHLYFPNQIDQNNNNKYSELKQEEQDQPKELQGRLNRKLSHVRQKTQQTNLDDEKYFFNFKQYFYKNYGEHFQGINTCISWKTQHQLDNFQNNMIKLINN